MTFTESQLDTYETADKALDAISDYLSRYCIDLNLDAYDAIQTELVSIIKNSEVITRKLITFLRDKGSSSYPSFW